MVVGLEAEPEAEGLDPGAPDVGVPEALDGPGWPGVETGGEPEAGGAVDELGRTEVLPEAGDAGLEVEDEARAVDPMVADGVEPLLGLVPGPKDTGAEAVYDGAEPPALVADTIVPPGFVTEPPGTPGIELEGTPGTELGGTPGSEPGGIPGVPVVVTGGTFGV